MNTLPLSQPATSLIRPLRSVTSRFNNPDPERVWAEELAYSSDKDLYEIGGRYFRAASYSEAREQYLNQF